MMDVAKAEGTGQITEGYYWAATECANEESQAWAYNFGVDGWVGINKNRSHQVRACFAY